jgi:tetratricopeptide (TPR) repeat protein
MNPSSRLSLALRSLSLLVILYQFRLLAGELADTPVFAVNLVAAFLSSYILAAKQVRHAQALCILAAVPWAARFLIAAPRLFAPGIALTLDSLLLHLDRNNLVSLLPFYWAAFSTYCAARSRSFLRADIAAADGLLIVLFSIAETSEIAVYRWPALMIALFLGVILLQLFALILSLPPEARLRRREAVGAALALLALALTGGLLFLGPSQEQALDKGGGLLEPKLFNFDFAQVVKLEPEISMNDDMVFIIKKDSDDRHNLARRYVLSSYNGKQGFSRTEADEQAHPQRIPRRATPVDLGESEAVRTTNQEYYIVNFDTTAFIGMNAPALIMPFETWDASSFSSAYAVRSSTSIAGPPDLINAVQGALNAEAFGMSAEDYAVYTEYGNDERIAALARSLAGGVENYWRKIQIVFEYLKHGDYRYSLRPGIAPDADQLGFFLFQSKKGYCSYYASAFALLLRSLGIPARLAAGFLIDLNEGVFDYYPIRANMAHAWVEVYFPGYGWIEYDPTTNILAEGEEFGFPSDISAELERLLKEILDNRDRLVLKEGGEEEEGSRLLSELGKRALYALRRHWLVLLILSLGLVFACMRGSYWFAARFLAPQDPRQRAAWLWAHSKQRLRLAAYRKPARLAESAWARSMEQDIPHVYSLYQHAAAARYAPFYSADEYAHMEAAYALFAQGYARRVSRGRRALGLLCPPLALVLRNRNAGRALTILLFLAVLLGDAARAQNMDSIDSAPADALYQSAIQAQRAEMWERAIALYEEGAGLYPIDPRFSRSLGNLYYERRLYGLAWQQYQKVEELRPLDVNLLYRMSRTAAYLNDDAVSAKYLERLLDISPGNREAIGNLGWTYYKLHRLEEGERLMRDALERFGPDPDLSMTLGTLYSEMFRYEDAKQGYLDAIATAETIGDRLFLSVAYYNLSILETRFYQFDLAFDASSTSLEAQNRASGRLSRGELFQRRLEFTRVFGEYQTAYELDTSPLSKINLAQSYQIAGRLEEARLYAENCLSVSDLSWMLNYGTDPIRYKRDIYKILYKTYEGLGRLESFKQGGFGGLFRRLSYLVKAEEHRQLFRKYSLLSANAYSRYTGGELNPDALCLYGDAFEAYPRRALRYVEQARSLETPLIPESAPGYDFDIGRLLKSKQRIADSIATLDPIWERDIIADAYTELARLADSRGSRNDAIERLFALNAGALRQAGLSLPVSLVINSADTPRILRPLRNALKNAGLVPTEAARFRLTLTVNPGSINCVLHDNNRGTNLLNRAFPVNSVSGEDLSAFAQTVAEQIFTPQ